ncbi:chloride channel protein [Brucella pituitosa]|uniref:Chloride channel protein n=1 Tax=Brucella pituitosa TaxID=571256 RepID=A0ABS3JYG3_9HYPH|nr:MULTISPECIES: chloride channel protein [Brucella]PQZ49495.1 chloride channel protein [Ochrobactrum sp. MYb19]PRA57283.1 chloride channel protein [Ochrobactrum sp. MYb68]PRA66687.1 chloride channel protein [Ochrobactrum sp. MYb18]PRA76284.1 chloride channel protein [Brucella thiophenivorans]PRA89300.1 chloride channel protein [Ochrobactrum sp. MYb29]PRA91697.1 chloride channel protein [Ochrobactrum sp. MYb14]PRA98290.1 chloride channel protein [Ochrobactrum sp. MYb15]
MNINELRHNRYLRVLFVPFRMRALVRGSEIGLAIAGVVIGIISALAVAAIGGISQWMHQALFGLAEGERLSSASQLNPSAYIAPLAGGILMGVVIWVLARWRKKPIVDPIEANALHGGHLSLTDSFILVGQNLISNGFGASVGLEAAYTQLASGFASRIGRALKLRRADLRTLVGCGAAAAIASAFNAPLTGAFYAFELIIGVYSIATLAPVVVAAIVGMLVTQAIGGAPFVIQIGPLDGIAARDYVPALVLGFLAAGIAILIMRGVTTVERIARKSIIPTVMAPAIGGAIVGMIAFVSPQVLASGHGALHLDLNANLTIPVLLLLIFSKSLASAISIGSGFRGGLFFASLFLGALTGKLFAAVTGMVLPLSLEPEVYAVIGMSSMAVAIVGGPLTMAFLALELTGDFPIAMLVLGAVVSSSLMVRKTFGYSFATWRFHLRGEAIRSAHDIGWVRNLTVNRMMRHDVRTVLIDTDIETFRHDFPLGSTQRVIAVDNEGHYVGMIPVPEAYSESFDTTDGTRGISDLLRYQDQFLLPQMNAKEAVARFDRAEAEALAVINNAQERKVLGLLSEAHTLRRYSEELDRRRREVSGEV